MEIKIRKITAPPGLGDFIWLAQKLIHANEKFHVVMTENTPQRGHQLLQVLPQLIASHEYAPGITYSKLKKENIQNKKKQWSQVKEREFHLTANEHLELGNRIEEFFPDLPTSYSLNYATSEQAAKAAGKLAYDDSKRYIGLYTSAYSNSRNAGGWNMLDWLKLIRLMHMKNKDLCFVIIGAIYDVGITEALVDELRMARIPFINTTGQPLPVVIELLKRMRYFIGFPSGLSIINETLRKDGVMFYTQKDKGIINTWADPVRIRAGNIKECLFCPPAGIFDWIKSSYQLFEKL
jgi:ADP-heptose:LPS heptosyltransferase